MNSKDYKLKHYEKSVDIIVPVYNVKNYLKSCINSLINQTYKNIRILIIDDGSTDGSASLCDSIRKLDNRIVVYHKKNGGLFDARNYGLDRSTSDFICFVDADDYMPSNAISDLVENKLGTNAEVVFGGYSHVDKDNKKFLNIIPKKNILVGEEKFSILFESWLITSWGKLYDRNILKNVRFKPFYRAEDIFFYYDFAKLANKISLVDKSLYYYYSVREDSISNKSKITDYFVDLDGFVYMLINLENDKCSKDLAMKFQQFIYNYYAKVRLKAEHEQNIKALNNKFKEYDKKLWMIFSFKYKIRILLKVFLIKHKIREWFGI